MVRLEAYLDGNTNLKLAVFKNSQYENAILEGTQIFRLVSGLDNLKIVDFKDNNRDAKIVFENVVLNINEYSKIIKNKEFYRMFGPVLDNLKRHQEKLAVKRVKNKKVTRKNKYIGAKVMAAGLALVVIGTVAINNIHSKASSTVSLDSSYTQNYNSENNLDITTDYKNLVLYDNVDTTVEEANEESELPIVENIVLESNLDEQEISIEPENNISSVSISYNDESECEKAQVAKYNYKNLIEKYSKIYGIDSNLMMAIATQERGIHSQTMDPDGGLGLMQIQVSVWRNQNLNAYNFETQSWDHIIVDESKLSDLEYNVKVGCMIFQTYLNDKNYNIIAAIQSYNMGIGSVDKILRYYGSQNNKTKNEVLNNPTDVGWIDYRNIIADGDSKYIENVLRYYGNEGVVSVTKPSGEVVSLHINNQPEKSVSIK